MLLGGEDAGAVGVDVHELDLGELLGLEVADEGVGDVGGLDAVAVAVREVEALDEREEAPVVGEAAHAEVGGAEDDAVEVLGVVAEDAAGVDVDDDAPLGAASDFGGPFAREPGGGVRAGEEDVVGHADGVGLSAAAARAGGEEGEHGGGESQEAESFHHGWRFHLPMRVLRGGDGFRGVRGGSGRRRGCRPRGRHLPRARR